MDRVFIAIGQLEYLQSSNMGEESFSAWVNISDYLHYYSSRFISNLQGMFKEFTRSELKDFNTQNRNKMKWVSSHSFSSQSLIIPIPKGMVKSYGETLDSLSLVLKSVGPTTLKSDLLLLTNMIEKKTIVPMALFTKDQFTQNKLVISQSYLTNGLTHAPFSHALKNIAMLNKVNTSLLNTTALFYPIVLETGPAITHLEKIHSAGGIKEESKSILVTNLMSLAYRLSLFAVVMEHIQDMEHSFVETMREIMKRIE